MAVAWAAENTNLSHLPSQKFSNHTNFTIRNVALNRPLHKRNKYSLMEFSNVKAMWGLQLCLSISCVLLMYTL